MLPAQRKARATWFRRQAVAAMVAVAFLPVLILTAGASPAIAAAGAAGAPSRLTEAASLTDWASLTDPAPLGELASAGASSASVSPTPVPSCPVGADTWTGAAGAWETPGNWSKGLPTSSSYVCISGVGAAVTVNSTDTVTGLLLASGTSVNIASGGLTLAGGTTDSALQGALSVASSATLTVNSGADLLNATGGALTLAGTMTVDGGFEQDAGTVATAAGDNPVVLDNGSTLTLAGTGAGAFRLAYAYAQSEATTVSLVGDVAAGQSVEVPGGDPVATTLSATGSFTNAGTITLDKEPGDEYGAATISLPSGDTLMNTGTINVSGPAVGANNPDYDETFDGSLDNQGTLNVGVTGLPNAILVLPAGAGLTNSAMINVAAGSTLDTAGATTGAGAQPAVAFDNISGTIANAGAIDVAGSFTQAAGTVTTDPVVLQNGASLQLTGAGAGAFQVAANGATVTLSGDIAAGQSLEVQANDTGAGTIVNAAASFTNAGTITIDKEPGSEYGAASIDMPGHTLTNTGTINVSGPSVGASNPDYDETFDGSLDNQGTLNVGVTGLPNAILVLPAGAGLTNSATINVAAGSTLDTAGATTGAGAQPAVTVDNASGTIANLGAIDVAGAFIQAAGTVTTDPVVLTNGASLQLTGSGAGAFQVAANGATLALSGDIAAHQSLEVQANDTGAGTIVNAAASFTNAGTITIDKEPGSPYGAASIDMPGDTLTNTGTINVSGPAVGANDPDYDETFNGSLDNQGTLNVGVAGLPTAILILPAGANLTNTGALNVAAGSTLQTAATDTNGAGGVIANAGSIVSSGTFVQGAGTEQGISVTLPNGSSLQLTGSGAAGFAVVGAATVSLSGNLAAGQSLLIPQVNADTTVVNAAGTFTNAGAITIASQTGNGYGAATINLQGGTLTNTGTIEVQGPLFGANTSDQQDETINGAIDNEGTLTVGVSGAPAAILILPAGSLTNTGTLDVTGNSTVLDQVPLAQNGGSIAVASGSAMSASAAVTAKSGTIAAGGTFTSTNSFTEQGTTVSGSPVQVTAGKLSFAGTGSSSFLVPAGGDPSISGNIAPGQSLTINNDGGVCGGTVVNAPAAFTNAGTITFIDNVCPTAPAQLAVAGTVTNTGTISFQATSPGAGELDAPVINEASGTVSVDDGGLAKIDQPLIDDGSLSVNWGELDLAGGLTNVDTGTSTLTGGTYRVLGSANKPATLAIPNVFVGTLAASLEVGPDAAFIDPTKQTNATNVSVSTIAAGGTLTVDAGSMDAPTAAQLTNDGGVVLASTGQLDVASYAQGTSGSLTIELAGEPGSGDLGMLLASGSATLAGTLSIDGASGFTPLSGDVFTPISAATVTGTFSRVDTTPISGSLAYTAAYTPSAVQIDVGPGIDLAASAVTAPGVARVGQSLSVGWTVTALGQGVSGSWSDAVYLSPTPAMSARSVLVATTTHSGGLSAGQHYQGSLTATVPGLLPGNWYVVAIADAAAQTPDIDRANNVAASPVLAVSQTALAVGSSTPPGSTIPPDSDVYLQINPGAGTNVNLTATFAAPATGALYEAFGRVPGPGGYDQAPTSTSSAVQTVAIADAQSGPYFIDLDNPTSSPVPYTLGATEVAVVVNSVTPSSAGFVYAEVPDPFFACVGGGSPCGIHYTLQPSSDQPDLDLTITGAGFTPTSTATLSCTGLKAPYSGGSSGQFSATSVTFVSASTLYADFGPSFSPGGTCDVTVTSGAHSDQLAGAITFNSAFAQPGTSGTPQTPTVSIVAPSINRPNVDSEVVVNYSNPYSYEIPAPLMELDASGATLHYPDLPASSNTSLPLLGTAPTGDPGVLEPGQSGSVTVAFDSTQPGSGVVNFAVGTLDQPSDTLDLGAILAGLLPAATSTGVTSYVESQDADTTAGQVESMLDDDAAYLASIGHPAADAGQLFGFELNKITNYGAVVTNHSGGPFGYGMPGLVDSAAVDANGDVTISDPAGASTTFAKLAAGGYAAPPGVQSQLASFGSSWVMSQPDGSSAVFDGGGQLVSSTDAYGNTALYNYTGANLTSISEPDGDEITITYDPSSGDIAQIAESATGLTSSYTYDGAGRLTGISGGGTSEQLVWNESSGNEVLDGTLASVTNSAGITTDYSYDSAGQPASISRNGVTLERFSYPSSGTVEITDGAGNMATEQLDAVGQPARAVLGDGTTVSDSLSSQYAPGSVTIGDVSALFGYDGEGDLASATNPDGDQTSLSYSAPSLLSGVSAPDGLQTQLTTNGEENVTALTDPAGNSTDLAYTPTGEVASLTDRDGNATGYTYNAAGQLTSLTLPGGGVESFAYDADHNLVSASDSAGTTSYAYDADNRLTGVDYPNGLGIAYTYDSAGRRASETTSDGYRVNYNYGSGGNLASLTDGSGDTIVSYSYDANGFPTAVTNGNGTSTDYTYDARGTIASVVNKAPDGSTTSSFTYARNSLGQTTSMTTGSGTSTYAYDAAGQLVKATLAGGRTLSFSYDAAGNRTATADSASSPATYTLGADDEYSSAGATTYAYDADGNLMSSHAAAGTTNYTWNAFGQLASADGPSGDVSYTYDPLGNLIATDTNGKTTNLLPDPQTGALLGTYDGTSAMEHFPYGIGVVGQAGASGATSYFSFDGSGNVVSLSAPSGAVLDTSQYLPFGQIASSTGSTPTAFGFSGQFGVTTDPVTGLTDNGARYYDPASGRFISQDPVPFSAPNPYEYADNDPLDQIDLTGEDPAPIDYALDPAVSLGLYSANHANFGISDAGNQANRPADEKDYVNGTATLAGDAATIMQAPAQAFAAVGNFAKNTAISSGNLNAVGTVLKYDNAIQGAAKFSNAANITGTIFGAGQAVYQLSNGQVTGASGGIVTAANTFLSYVSPIPGTGLFLQGAESVLDSGSNDFGDWFASKWYGYDPNGDFTDHTKQPSTTHTSHDPNDMVGPAGYGNAGYVQGGTPLPYEVEFSNLAGADLPAATVTVTETLDPGLDLSTFSLGSFGFADHTITPPPGLRSYQTTINDTAVSGLDVHVSAAVDTTTRTVTWTFTSVDPATGLAPTDAALGFLAPDQTPPQGEGFVSYDVTPLSSATTGTIIAADATVQFDQNAPMTTATVSNTIDAGAPTATVAALPGSETGPFTVSWSGSDDQGGSGIAGYDVDVSDNGGPYTPLESATTATSTTFTGQPGHVYAFIAWATDNAGNVQPQPTEAQAATLVSSPTTSTSTSTSTLTSTSTSTSSSAAPTTSSQTTTTTNSTSTSTAQTSTTATTTSAQTAAATPHVSLRTSTVKVAKTAVPLSIACAAAPCSGTATLSVTKSVAVRKGKKTVHKRETVTYASATYAAAAGQTITVKLALNGAGRAALDAAKGKRLSVTATLTVASASPVKGVVVLEFAPAKASHKKKKG